MSSGSSFDLYSVPKIESKLPLEGLESRDESESDAKVLNDTYIVYKPHLGQGAFGVVKKATLKSDPNRNYAIKIFRIKKLMGKKVFVGGPKNGRPVMRTAFDSVCDEVVTMKKIRNECVVALFDVLHCEEKEKLYLLLSYCDYRSTMDSGDNEKNHFYIPHFRSSNSQRWKEIQNLQNSNSGQSGGFFSSLLGTNSAEFSGPPSSPSAYHDTYPEPVARSLFTDALKGLVYLHDRVHLCHRDIKPMNLLVDRNGLCKIGDYGRAYMFSQGPSYDEVVGEGEYDTRVEGTEGTYSFFSPEMCALDEKNEALTIYGDKHDVWSLGVSLYCFLYGRCPFWGNSIAEIFDVIASADVNSEKFIWPDERQILSDSTNTTNKNIKLYEVNTGVEIDSNDQVQNCNTDNVNKDVNNNDNENPNPNSPPLFTGQHDEDDPDSDPPQPDWKTYPPISDDAKTLLRSILIANPKDRPSAKTILESSQLNEGGWYGKTKEVVEKEKKERRLGIVAEFFNGPIPQGEYEIKRKSKWSLGW